MVVQMLIEEVGAIWYGRIIHFRLGTRVPVTGSPQGFNTPPILGRYARTQLECPMPSALYTSRLQGFGLQTLRRNHP